MSADPTAEHIDAVALQIESGHYEADGEGDRIRLARDDARRLLISTDPAVHAALAASLPAEVMLAALVDRGTLAEEVSAKSIPCGCRLVGATTFLGSCCIEGRGQAQPERRLVTPWEVAP